MSPAAGEISRRFKNVDSSSGHDAWIDADSPHSWCRSLLFRHTLSGSVERVLPSSPRSPEPDDTPLLRRLARLGAPYDGCVSRAHLFAANISYRHAQSLVERAALTPVLTRVFVTGGVDSLSHAQLRHAALLNAGTDARLSGWSALEVHGVTSEKIGTVHVVNARPKPNECRRTLTRIPMSTTSAAGVVELRTPRTVGPIELVRDWPVEPVATALRQASADMSKAALTRAWREADYLGLLSTEAVEAECRRGRAGSGRLRALLASQPPVAAGDRFRSRPEHLLLQELLKLGVPRPLVNVTVEFGGRSTELDFFMALALLNAEVDGPQHLLPTRRREDEERDRWLRGHGVEVMRFQHTEVEADARACATAVAQRRDERIAEIADRTGATSLSVHAAPQTVNDLERSKEVTRGG